mgnify:CR=1 FL=1
MLPWWLECKELKEDIHCNAFYDTYVCTCVCSIYLCVYGIYIHCTNRYIRMNTIYKHVYMRASTNTHTHTEFSLECTIINIQRNVLESRYNFYDKGGCKHFRNPHRALVPGFTQFKITIMNVNVISKVGQSFYILRFCLRGVVLNNLSKGICNC